MLMEYQDVFEGFGTFAGDPYHIQLTPDVVPVKHIPRNISVHLCDVFKKVLDNMIELGIIRNVPERSIPSPWANSFVVNKKKPDGAVKLWVCLDTRDLNKYTVREPIYSRKPVDLIPCLEGSRPFTLVNM